MKKKQNENCKKQRVRQERGITLIALIITIIILIILAAISINAIIDTRMIQTAVSGAENYVEAGETENEVMQDTADYIDSIVASIKGEDTSGGSSGTGTDLSTLSETERLALVGQYVDYEPDSGNSYTLAQSSTYTGNTNNSTAFTTDTDLNWQIWSITDDTLTLISDTTQQTGGYYNSSSTYCLYLAGTLGYTNGVNLLNDICKTCYSSSSVNETGVKATARSLNIQDIEEVLDWSKWAPTDYIYSSTYPCYDMNTTKQYTSSDGRWYPNIWEEEDFANIDGTTVNTASYTYDSITGTLSYISTNSTLRRSDNISTLRTSIPWKKASTYIAPTETFWYASASTLSSAWLDEDYASLVGCGSGYWLASRYVGLGTDMPRFGVMGVLSDGSVGGGSMYTSYNTEVASGDSGLRPVIEIPLASLTLDLTSNTGDTSDDAYQIVAK